MNKLTVSQKALAERKRKAAEAKPAPKPKKRDNTFSKSRDIREDRDMRQVKTDKPHAYPRAV